MESLVPVLVDRRQPTDLSAVIENAIDRSLIAGLKPSAAEGIADGTWQPVTATSKARWQAS